MAIVALLAVATAPLVTVGTVSAALPTAAYVPLTPYRLADTRVEPCGCTRLDAATIAVDVAGRQGVPSGTVAVAVTVTATESHAPGFVTVYPGGAPRPGASTLNTRPDRAVANSAIVQLGDDGRLELYQLTGGDLIVDITGAFVAAESSAAGRFVPAATQRLVDTREAGPFAGALPAGGELTVPLPGGVPTDASAIAVNVTSVDEPQPGYLAARPAGSPPGTTSFLNMNGSGKAVAATAILPVSSAGLTLFSRGAGT